MASLRSSSRLKNQSSALRIQSQPPSTHHKTPTRNKTPTRAHKTVKTPTRNKKKKKPKTNTKQKKKHGRSKSGSCRKRLTPKRNRKRTYGRGDGVSKPFCSEHRSLKYETQKLQQKEIYPYMKKITNVKKEKDMLREQNKELIAHNESLLETNMAISARIDDMEETTEVIVCAFDKETILREKLQRETKLNTEKIDELLQGMDEEDEEDDVYMFGIQRKANKRSSIFVLIYHSIYILLFGGNHVLIDWDNPIYEHVAETDTQT